MLQWPRRRLPGFRPVPLGDLVAVHAARILAVTVAAVAVAAQPLAGAHRGVP